MSHQIANPHIDRPVFGMLCALGAFFLFAVMNVFAKILAEDMHVIEVAFFRNAIAVIPLLIWVYGMNRRDILVIKSSPKGIIARSILGTVSLGVTFAAFSHLPFADATALLFTASLIVPIFGYFFLKEYVGPYRWSAILIGFVGVLIMAHPTGAVNMTGVSFALGAAIMHATLQTIVRALGKTESPQTVTFYFMFVGAFVCLIPMPLVFTMPTWADVPYLVGVGVTGLLAQILISTAYKYAQAAIVTVFNYSGIIWSMLFGWMIWDDFPTIYIITGAVIVIASNLFMLYRENKLARSAKVTVHEADVL